MHCPLYAAVLLLVLCVLPNPANAFQQDNEDEFAIKRDVRKDFLAREKMFFQVEEHVTADASTFNIVLFSGQDRFDLADEEDISRYSKHLNDKANRIVSETIKSHSLTPAEGRKLAVAAKLQIGLHCREIRRMNSQLSDSQSAMQLGNYALRASRYSGIEFEDSLFYKVLARMISDGE